MVILFTMLQSYSKVSSSFYMLCGIFITCFLDAWESKAGTKVFKIGFNNQENKVSTAETRVMLANWLGQLRK